MTETPEQRKKREEEERRRRNRNDDDYASPMPLYPDPIGSYDSTCDTGSPPGGCGSE